MTAENNANVAIWNVIGPKPPGDEKIPPGFFERLGMTAPPASGDYFVGLKAIAIAAPGQVNAASEAMAKFAVRRGPPTKPDPERLDSREHEASDRAP